MLQVEQSDAAAAADDDDVTSFGVANVVAVVVAAGA